MIKDISLKIGLNLLKINKKFCYVNAINLPIDADKSYVSIFMKDCLADG